MARWLVPPGELRQALRTLGRTPAFTALSLVTLALGIGAATAMFSLVHGVLLEGLPYDDPDRLVYIDHEAPALGFDGDLGSASGLHRHYERFAESVESVGYWETRFVTVTGRDAAPARVRAIAATASLFTTLRQRPLHGRLLAPAEDAADGERAVLLSHGFWQRRFGGDPAAVGRDLEISGENIPVVGVLPAGFRFADADLILDNERDLENNFGGFNGGSIARLRPGVTLDALRAELDTWIEQIDRSFPDPAIAGFFADSELAARPVPMKEWLVGPASQVLWVLMGAVGLVLLIACANVANLFFVRSEARQREVAVRHAIGASRGRILRGFLTESLLLSLSGSLLGLGLARGAVPALLTRVPFDLPRAENVGINTPVMLFALFAGLLAGFAFGTLPLLQRGVSLGDALRDGSRSSTTGRARLRTRQTLVVAQIALSLVLLSGAGLMGRSFARLTAVDVGFSPVGLLSFQLSLPAAQYPEIGEVVAFHDSTMDRLRALPGVLDVGAARDLPLGGRSGGDTLVRRDAPSIDGEPQPLVWVTRASPTYFRAIGVPVLSGRAISQTDQAEGRPVVVLNRAAVDIYFDGQDPVGREIAIGSGGEPVWQEVVGVVRTTKRESLAEKPTPMAYITTPGETFNTARQMSYVLRVDGDPLSLADSVRAVMREIAPDLPVIRLQSMEQTVADAGAPTAFIMVMLGLAAGVAVLLGSIGVYGVISYAVAQRTAEIGIRMALGAAGRDVRRMLLGQGGTVALVGLAIGLGGTLLLARTVESQLYGVDPFDPLTHLTTTALLLVIALLATALPAWRASRIDPNVALRSDG